MANSEGPVGPAPAAWVWSHYRGVVSDAAAPAPTPAPAPEPLPEPAKVAAAEAPAANLPPPTAAEEPKNSTLLGVGIAAAILVIAGLTWLFTSGGQPASSPASESTPASEGAPVKSEAAPPAAEPAPAAATTSAPAPAAAPAAATEAPKSQPAAHGPEHTKKKKRH